jgi:hypothetical protein
VKSVAGNNVNPPCLAMTYIGQLVGHVTWEGARIIQGIVVDLGPTYAPQVPVLLLWLQQPYMHAVINWTCTTEIEIRNAQLFYFEYTNPNNPHPHSIPFNKLTLNTQIQVSVHAGVFLCWNHINH